MQRDYYSDREGAMVRFSDRMASEVRADVLGGDGAR